MSEEILKRDDLDALSTDELKRLRGIYETKAGQYDDSQMAFKILINSLYGALGSAYFRYSDTYKATAITLTGQASVQWAAKYVNAYLNRILGTDDDYVVGIDTDSLYVNLTPLVENVTSGQDLTMEQIIDFMDKVSDEKIQPVIAEAYADFAERTNAYENRLDMKREKLGSGIFVQKKRYAFKTYDNEGVRFTEPKISITGLEAVRSTTPAFCRNEIKRLLKLCFDADQETMIQEIEKCREEFENLSAMQIAMPTGVNDLEKWHTEGAFISRTPFHVKASIIYNRLIRQKSLEHDYGLIKSGDKVRLIHLKTPNPFGTEGIAFPDFLPPELEVEDYIDYDTQFEKTFLKPLRRVLDVMGWKTYRLNTLKSFFKKG